MRDQLARRTLQLVNVPSVSREEAELADIVAAEVPLALRHREGSTLLFEAPRTGKPLVLLAGHLDTVPPQENIPGRLEDGVVHGLGAADMKAGLAVMVELARWAHEEAAPPAVDLAFLFFPREELPAAESAVPPFLASGLVDDAQLVVVLEPTANAIQAGCLGHLAATVVFEGRSGHSARPWLADNAIHRAVRALGPVASLPPRDVELSGLVFREVLSVTEIRGGIATNVVPDRVEARLSYRYAPDRTPAEAEAELARIVGPEGRLEELGNSPPARVVVDTPLARALREAGAFAVEPKQAWTPVAEFSAHGLDALNLGPGDPRYAHARDEQVDAASLERTFRALQRFALGSV
ncbi:MAG TPA: succinyl-diaminopimelate desuccinylase [Gaiellaceae bacterium]|nr:succinyl-diaminopimelate desuccinylase [Gaiellaceae bacterium]